MEFGSDFNLLDYPKGSNAPLRIKYNLYASGRQALKDIVQSYDFNTIWIPTYYCGESTEFLYKLHPQIKRYSCIPTDDPEVAVSDLRLDPNDLLLRLNYFGLHGFQDNSEILCKVIEDHSHNLKCEWVKKSNADWCFASLRKTLPIADGGVLWSPINLELPQQPECSKQLEECMNKRYEAMRLKTEYLNGLDIQKETFLQLFHETEDNIDDLELSNISTKSHTILSDFNHKEWENRKLENFKTLLSQLKLKHAECVLPQAEQMQTPFSLILLFKSKQARDDARAYLIQNQVYPAILWGDVVGEDMRAGDFSERMLSIHCDGRYSKYDMIDLSKILNKVI